MTGRRRSYALLAVAMVGCMEPLTIADWPLERVGPLEMRIDAPAAVQQSDTVAVTIRLRNNSAAPYTAYFGGMGDVWFIDLTAMRADGSVVWRLYNRGMLASLTNRTFGPHEEVVTVRKWPLVDNEGQGVPVGTYWVRGSLRIIPEQPQAPIKNLQSQTDSVLVR